MKGLIAQSCPTLCDPMNCVARQAPLSMEFSRQEYWSGLPFPSPGMRGPFFSTQGWDLGLRHCRQTYLPIPYDTEIPLPGIHSIETHIYVPQNGHKFIEFSDH